MRLKESDLQRIVNRVIREEENVFGVQDTVLGSNAFSKENIPVECKDNPEVSSIEVITACIGVIKQKSEDLTNALAALNNLQSNAKSFSAEMSESKRYTRLRGRR